MSVGSRRQFLQWLQWLSGAAATAAAASALPGCGDTRPRAPQRERVPPSAARSEGGADLLIVGGTIATLAGAGVGAVEALAVGDGQVLAAGTRDQVEGLRGAKTRVLDLAGGLAVPGLTDAHAHLMSLGKHLESVDLTGASSLDEVIARVRAHAAKQPGSGWILGRGWDQNRWDDSAMPHHQALSAAFPGRPVWLRRVDGHAGLGNQVALDRAGIGADTAAPQGGEILRDPKGRATGVLVDTAMGLIPVPAPSEAERKRWLLAGQARALSLGITGVHDMGVDMEVDTIYRALTRDKQLRLRVHAYADHDWFADLVVERNGTPPTARDLYALKGVKLYMDGALGSRGAALLDDYSDRPGHRGKLQHDPAELVQLCVNARVYGWQVACHAIGDRGIREILGVYAKAFEPPGPPGPELRWRVEHSQIVHLDDITRYVELGVVASMQPTHATSDMAWVPARLGPERLAGAYAWRRFLDAGVPLALGSDFPVEAPDITHGLYAAITRTDEHGQPEGGWLPDQKLTLLQAIAGFTRGAAYAVHREGHLGQLTRGYQADITCFERDLFALTPAELRGARARATIVAGDVVWEA